MRKSVLHNDPGYDPDAFSYQVYLDGKRLDKCVTADEEKGEAVVWLSDDNYGLKTLSGKVELRRENSHDKQR
jgi:hypothetical protein